MAFPKKVNIPNKTNAFPITDLSKQISAEEINQIAEAINENALFYGAFSNLSILQSEYPNPTIGGWAYLNNGDRYEAKADGTWTISNSGSGGFNPVLTRYVAAATGASETITLPDDVNAGDVFFKGLRLDEVTEYSQAGDELTITPNGGVSSGDIIHVKQYGDAVGTEVDDFQLWIDKNIELGHYLPSEAVLDKARAQVERDKLSGVWQTRTEYYIWAWNDLQMEDASLVGFKNRIKAEPSGTGYTVDGWRSNNTFAGYINTKIIPSIHGGNLYTASDANILYSNFGTAAADKPMIGTADGTLKFINSDSAVNKFNSTSARNYNTRYSGLKSISRFSDSFVQVVNGTRGVYDYTDTDVVSLPTTPILVFTDGQGNFGNLGLTTLSFGGSITSAQALQYRLDWNEYLVSIGLTAQA